MSTLIMLAIAVVFTATAGCCLWSANRHAGVRWFRAFEVSPTVLTLVMIAAGATVYFAVRYW